MHTAKEKGTRRFGTERVNIDLPINQKPKAADIKNNLKLNTCRAATTAVTHPITFRQG